ncbi:DUF4164 family protein [Microvirga sp. W0021]|uniref:DUF4164 family protein n=1 Tax=Hohaiivirga grylli TaxID=3133970 RepID=A0ABV0BJM0_9HYPH
MASSLDDALKRLDTALGMLEASVTRRLDAEKQRGDLETELQIMQDDRARLAVELEGAGERIKKLDAVTEDVQERVARAASAIQQMLSDEDH